MNPSDIVARLDMTRARLEAGSSGPTILAVTSATEADGKNVLAAALARSLAGVGHRVLLVDGNHGAPVLQVASAPKLSVHPEYDILSYVVPALEPGLPSLLSLVSPGVASSCSKETVEPTFALLRQHYAFTIVNAPVLVTSGNALSYACAADGVVIALKQGRAATKGDRELVKILQSAGVPVVGVVTLDAQTIRSSAAGWDGKVTGKRIATRSTPEEAPKSGAAQPVRLN